MDLSKYKALYHQESLKNLASVEEGLAALREGDGEAARRTVFRAMHTLKGQAAQMRDEPVYHLAHAAEDLLDGVGQGNVPFDDATLGLLDESAARLSTMLQAAVRGDPSEPATDLEQALRMHLRRAGTTGFHLVEAAPAPPPVEDEAAQQDGGALAAVAELMAVAQRLKVHASSDPQFESEAARLDAATRRIYACLTRLRQVGVESIIPAVRRHMNAAAESEGREVRLDVVGADALADPSVLGVLQSVLLHLVTNAVIHGIEPAELRRKRHKPRVGTIRLVVERDGDNLLIQLSDDGGGLDSARLMGEMRRRGLKPHDAVSSAFEPNVSTLTTPTLFAGRGVGLSAARYAIEQLGGTLQLRSTPGAGVTAGLVVPVRQRFEDLLLVEDKGQTVAFLARAATPSGDHEVILRNGMKRRVDRVLATVEGLVSPPPFPFNHLPRVNGTTVGVGGNILFVMDPDPAPPPPLPGASP